MRKLRITVDDKSYQVEVGDLGQSPIRVIVDGEEFRVTALPLEENGRPAEAPAATATLAAEPAGDDGQSQVTAPMPGMILEIAVQAGDRVQAGQVLCALEAMKMKSPIRAPRAGAVRQIQVHNQQTVAYGDLLFVVE